VKVPARIAWSQQHVERGLPEIERTIDPAWFVGEALPANAGWSLVCRFMPSPRAQGNPTFAEVEFLMPEAPAHRLVPGAKLRLFDRWTHDFADVEIVR
jgi:hypothetical protein